MSSHEQPVSGPIDRRYEASFAVGQADGDGDFLFVAGVKVRAYLAGGVVNISVDMSRGGAVPYAVHVEGEPGQTWHELAGVPRSLLR